MSTSQILRGTSSRMDTSSAQAGQSGQSVWGRSVSTPPNFAARYERTATMQAMIAMLNGESALALLKSGPLRALAMAHLRGIKKWKLDVPARAGGHRFAILETPVAQM